MPCAAQGEPITFLLLKATTTNVPQSGRQCPGGGTGDRRGRCSNAELPGDEGPWGKLQAKSGLAAQPPPSGEGNLCDLPRTLPATQEPRKGVSGLAMVMWETKANEN